MQNEFIFSFEKLAVYQLSLEFTSKIYKGTKDFPKGEKYGLTSQIRHAAVSVSSNIAEGCGRYSKREQARFMEIAYGSLLEVICQLEIGKKLNYLDQDTKTELRLEGVRICQMLQKLRRAFLKAK